MLDSLRVTTRGIKRTKKKATPHLFLKWKNEHKCRAILDVTPVIDMDPIKPPKFKLPWLEESLLWLGEAGQ